MISPSRIFTPLVLAAALSAACATTRTAGTQLDDATVTSKVEAKLAGDPQVSGFNVDVDTMDGVVTLRGEVESATAKAEAEKLARDTEGVRGVRNELSVVEETAGAGERLSDGWITAKIKAALAADAGLNPFNIDVDTTDGVVTLSGVVANAENRAKAEEVARGIEGVVRVENELRVE